MENNVVYQDRIFGQDPPKSLSNKNVKKLELLTEEEKRANHIASEQRRRQNIRSGYDQLISVVPTLSDNQRSEGVILQKSVEYIKFLLMEREILHQQLEDLKKE
ncbi:hypothetical protein BB559_003948 [Furculomyces boomerangus]|uniref:BHLH domain-containing protein n=1 Tax=Furculomyces boomerangus TaxID=61424 RepID=A0A2T9YHR1_9FUNG|nr:hypothetical protein BB559_003948 [Furculomyces boomerangus]